MVFNQMEPWAVRRNLEDAGCTQDMIEAFMDCFEHGSRRRQLRILEELRAWLLECVHDSQRRLERLDYLIYNLRKDAGGK